MNTFEKIDKNKDKINGIIDPHKLHYYYIYKYYRTTTGSKMMRYTSCAIRFNCDERTVMRAVKCMES